MSPRKATRRKKPGKPHLWRWLDVVVEAARTCDDPKRPQKPGIIAVAAIRMSHADADGRNCFPSVELVAKKAGMHADTVRKVDAWLVAQGLMAVTRKISGNVKDYQLLLPPVALVEGQPGEVSVALVEGQPGDASVAPPVALADDPVEGHNPPPPKEVGGREGSSADLASLGPAVNASAGHGESRPALDASEDDYVVEVLKNCGSPLTRTAALDSALVAFIPWFHPHVVGWLVKGWLDAPNIHHPEGLAAKKATTYLAAWRRRDAEIGEPGRAALCAAWAAGQRGELDFLHEFMRDEFPDEPLIECSWDGLWWPDARFTKPGRFREALAAWGYDCGPPRPRPEPERAKAESETEEEWFL